jgi:cyclic dehypoxanthinyl futalosine synthase
MMTHDEALTLLRSTDLVGIGFRADALRKQLHPEPVASYALNTQDNGPSANVEDQTAKLQLTPQSTPEQRLSSLDALRTQQEATGQFLCFTVIAHGDVTASEYMKVLAISRLYLDNIFHAQIPVASMDTKLAQVAIRFGANDLGAVTLEDTGDRKAVTEEQVRRLIRDAGLTPKQRDNSFRTYFLY